MAKKKVVQKELLEKQLWKSADKLIFLKYISDALDDFDFTERFNSLKAEFEGQLKEEAALNQRILENLAKVKL